MRLVRIKTFREICFGDGDAPDPRTVRRGIENGDIPGRRVGGEYYVDIEAFRRQTGTPFHLDVLRGDLEAVEAARKP